MTAAASWRVIPASEDAQGVPSPEHFVDANNRVCPEFALGVLWAAFALFVLLAWGVVEARAARLCKMWPVFRVV